MFLSINGATGEWKSDVLENRIKGLAEMNSWAPTKIFTTKIDTFNNYKVLLVNYEYKNQEIGKYIFYSLSKNNKKVLNGTLEYLVADREKATEIVNNIIKSIKFK
ncbi:hypothetical protein [Pedobacter steynii]